MITTGNHNFAAFQVVNRDRQQKFEVLQAFEVRVLEEKMQKRKMIG